MIEEYKITHVLSVLKYTLDLSEDVFRGIQHLSIDIDDLEDEDILVHFPKMVRFIDRGLYGREVLQKNNSTVEPSLAAAKIGDKNGEAGDEDAILPAGPESTLGEGDSPSSPGAVLVHCAMGKSRSVSAVIAYLLWKHPHRYGRSKPTTTSYDAVMQALQWVRATRPIAEPNEGFMRQLEMWWEMWCPADSDDAVEHHPAYQRWLYKREVEDAARIGRAPDWIRFEDEEAEKDQGKERDLAAAAAAGLDVKPEGSGRELRCKKCRRVLATQPFIVPHQGRGNAERQDCPHVFIEALSWMRETLDAGELEGRLACPNAKCGASVGRYAWQGFKCSCGDWVAPAFSLQKSKVDEVVISGGGGRKSGGGVGGGVDSAAARMAALGIRMPPGRKENL